MHPRNVAYAYGGMTEGCASRHGLLDARRMIGLLSLGLPNQLMAGRATMPILAPADLCSVVDTRSAALEQIAQWERMPSRLDVPWMTQAYFAM